MSRALWVLIETAGSLLVTACVLRAYAQAVRAHPRNPLVHFIVAVTDWLVRPLRRVLPSRSAIDWPSLAAALLVAVLLATAFVFVFSEALAATGRMPGIGAILVLAVGWMIRWSLYAVMGLVLLQAVLSWVNPDAPLAPAVDQLTRPFLAPVRRVIPLVGGFDLSPLVVFVVIQVLLAVIDPVALAF